MFKRLGTILALVLLSTASVSACSNADPAADSESEAGSLRLPVVSADGVYRLRQAVFVVTGSTGATLTLDGDANGAANELLVDLEPGNYTVELRDGWSLERLAEGGEATTIQGALLSPNPTSFEVRHNRTSEVVYSFGSDQGTVSFGSGKATISIDVVSSTPVSNCDVVQQTGCASGQSCLLRDESGATFCADAGSLPADGECDSEQCVPGAQCLAVNGSSTRVCSRFGNPSVSTLGCVCHPLSIAPNVGVCDAAPPGACNPLTQTGCSQGQGCHYESGPYGTCGNAGSTSIGQPCSGDVCAPGLECYGDDPNTGLLGTCYAFCTGIDTFCGPIPTPPWYSVLGYCRNIGPGALGLCRP